MGRIMKYWELEQNKAIEEFLKDITTPTKEDLFRFFEYHFLHPDHETEFTHKVAKNIIEISFDYFSTLPKEKKPRFLRALGKLFDVALSLKIWEYQLSRDDASWYWSGLPAYFLSLASLAEPLEDMRRELGEVDTANLHEKVVCVEGDTEFNFIKNIQLLTRFIHLDFQVYTYGCKGEANNLAHFIKEKNRQGLKVFVVYDKDGREKSFVNKIKKRSQVEDFFAFSRDFESAFPPEILTAALNDYLTRYVEGSVPFIPDDVQGLLDDKESFIKALEKKHGISISKPKLGTILGVAMSVILERRWNEIFNSEVASENYDYEIFEFVKFLVES